MELRIPHKTTQAKARAKVESLLEDAAKKHGHMIHDLQHHWEGHTLEFDFRAAGMKVSGSLEVTAKELVVRAKVPLFAKPFEPKIAHAIEAEAKKHFA